MTGKLSYLAGLHAEEQVARAYQSAGHPIIARRWRGTRGEIDLIARQGDVVVFVEVKKSRTHDMAAQYVTEWKRQRIFETVDEFLCGEPKGLATEVRIDLALVDQMGRIEILENAFAA